MFNNKSYFLNNNHVVIDRADRVELYSYESFICYYDKENNTLHINNMWDYSNTTRKYFKKFVNDYTCFTYDSKARFLRLIEDSKKIIIHNNNILAAQYDYIA